MKKTLIVLAVLFITSLSCKKIIDPGGGLCACSPVQEGFLTVVLKNNAGADLLNPATAGYLSKEKIQLYIKNVSGGMRPINFEIRQPFSYDNEKFEFYQLFSAEIFSLATSADTDFYLKLGESKEYVVNLKKMGNKKVEKLLIDKVEVPFEKSTPTPYDFVNSIFSFKQP